MNLQVPADNQAETGSFGTAQHCLFDPAPPGGRIRHRRPAVPSCLRVLLHTFFLLALLSLLNPAPASAYIGPGAGFAFVSSFLIVLLTFLLAIFTLLTWPVRWLIQILRRPRALSRSRVRRVLIVGLDGQDPDLTDSFLKEGILPNFQRLQEMGSYHRLRTTLPAESPVAWSSFQTGCNPGRHRVFDFLVPNRKSYLPELCSAQVKPPRRHLKLGKYRIPLGKSRIEFGRKSQSFWKVLGDHGVFSTILRVPITFPPEPFHGLLLSAMSVPDLNGTQGTFAYYTSDPEEQKTLTGGVRFPLQLADGGARSFLSGPENPFLNARSEMRIPFHIRLAGDKCRLKLDGSEYDLPLREFTPWLPIQFRGGLGFKVRGMCRFYLLEVSPHFRLYVTPLNIDPDKPALPVSYPVTYSIYLAKTQGSFSTLGLAEDTWALNERILDENAFLEQAYQIHAEREKMFFDAVAKTRRGLVTCVFDITDRLQHMFWRYQEENHPANQDKECTLHKDALRNLYREMDRLVGRVLKRTDEETLVMVMSDHGFKSFQRGVNLNSWLHQNGYLVLHGEPENRDYFEQVNWEKTRAYAVGLGGIYLNLKGRETKGIVCPGAEARQIKKEIIQKLSGLVDPERMVPAVANVYDTAVEYSGPYVEEAPELVVGFHPGYRVSWSCATGTVTGRIFEDNQKSWSGDHCVDPSSVPGVFFCSRRIEAEDPAITDIGPTVLDLFGVPVPSYCDGRSLLPVPAEGNTA